MEVHNSSSGLDLVLHPASFLLLLADMRMVSRGGGVKGSLPQSDSDEECCALKLTISKHTRTAGVVCIFYLFQVFG